METEIVVRPRSGGKAVVLLKLTMGKAPMDNVFTLGDVERLVTELRAVQLKMIEIEKVYADKPVPT